AKRNSKVAVRDVQVVKVCMCDRLAGWRFDDRFIHELDMRLKAGQHAKRVQHPEAIALDADRTAHASEARRLLIHGYFITCVARSNCCHQAGWTTTDNADARRTGAQPI